MPALSVKFEKHLWQFKIRDMADASVVTEIFKLREYRSAESFIISAKHQIIDVGAHLGAFSIYCRALNSNVAIAALEPDPQNLLALKDNLALNNLSDIEILPKALAAATGPRELLISRDSINHRLLSRDEQKTLVQKVIPISAISLSDLFALLNSSARSDTSASTSDNRANKIDLIKLDIEGGEFEIIKETPDKFLKIPRIWILEYHDNPDRKHYILSTRFKTLGYGVQRFPSKFEKRLGFLLATRK